MSAHVITDRKARLNSRELHMMRITAGNEASNVLKISTKQAESTGFHNGDIVFIADLKAANTYYRKFKEMGLYVKQYVLHTKIRKVDTGEERYNTWILYSEGSDD
jgi:hypothetical protein